MALLSFETIVQKLQSIFAAKDKEKSEQASGEINPSLSPRTHQQYVEEMEAIYLLFEWLGEMENEFDPVFKQILIPLLLKMRARFMPTNKHNLTFFGESPSFADIIHDIKWLVKYRCHPNKGIPHNEGIRNEGVPNEGISNERIPKKEKIHNITEYEMHLVTMIAYFLRMVSFPVNLDFIYAYVVRLDNSLSKQYVESLLRKYSTFFQMELTETGIEGWETKYSYIQMKPIINI